MHIKIFDEFKSLARDQWSVFVVLPSSRNAACPIDPGLNQGTLGRVTPGLRQLERIIDEKIGAVGWE